MRNKVVGGLVIACVAVAMTAATRDASAQEPPDAAVHLVLRHIQKFGRAMLASR